MYACNIIRNYDRQDRNSNGKSDISDHGQLRSKKVSPADSDNDQQPEIAI